MDNYTIDYNEQMLNYYPEIIRAVREFQALIKSQASQIADVHVELNKLLTNAFIESADEERLAMWEKFLSINPSAQGYMEHEHWLISRRDVILARLFQCEKLNATSIKDIVRIFTGETCETWIINGTLYVKIYPHDTNKAVDVDTVVAELKLKCPAHLNLAVYQNYVDWHYIYNTHTWESVSTTYPTWGDLINGNPNVSVLEYIVDECGGYITDESNNRLFN